MITNNISIDQIYEKSIIKPLIEFNKFRGLFIYKCINIIKDLFQVYKYLTGNYPVCQNFLICNNETSINEIISFLYRAILCNYHSCYIIGGIHNLNAENKNYLLKLLNNLIIETNGIINSCLIILNMEKELEISKKLESIKYKMFDENVRNELEKQIIDNISYIKLLNSDKSGIGKSTKIRNDVLKRNKKYIYFPINGFLNQINIIQRLQNLELTENSVIHLDIFDIDNIDLIEEFLFYIIITKSFIKNTTILYFPNDIEIYIEFQNLNDIKKFSIFSLIKFKEQNKLLIKNIEPLIFSKEKNSDLIIVGKYLKLIKKLNKEKKIQIL